MKNTLEPIAMAYNSTGALENATSETVAVVFGVPIILIFIIVTAAAIGLYLLIKHYSPQESSGPC